MGRHLRAAALTLLWGAGVGIGVFVAGSASSLGVTLLGRTVLLSVFPVAVLLGAYGLRHRPAATTVVLLALLVRAPTFTTVPTIDDGSFYLAAARQFLAGDVAVFGHAASTAVWAAFVAMFDQSGVNAANLVFSAATVPLVGVLARRLFKSRRAALGGMAVFAVSPTAVYYSAKAINEPLALFFLALAILLFLAERYPLAIAVTGAVAFMRIEYAVMFLVPYAVIRAVNRRSLRTVVLAMPPLGVSVVLLSAVVGVRVPLWRTFVGALGGVDLFSPLPIRRLLANPRTVFPERYQALAAHMVHWGVPYWNLVLVNPVIPVAAITAIVLGSRQRRRLAFGGGLALLGFAVVFLQSELLRGRLALSLPAIGLSLVTYTALVYFAVDDDPLGNELIASAYIYSLGILVLPPSPRYLLPVVLVYAVYAGRGIELAVDGVTARMPS